MSDAETAQLTTRLYVFVFDRKAVGKNGSDKDAGPSPRVKREADSDGGEEVVFGKKPRMETASANDLK